MSLYLNHVTLSTGHHRRAARTEVPDEALAVLHPWLLEAISTPEPVPLPVPELAHYSAHAMRDPEGKGLVLTVYGPWGPHMPGRPHKGEQAPLVTLGVAQRADEAERLWQHLVQSFGAHPSAQMPEVPWCAVALHETLTLMPEAAAWLGGFEMGVAWAWVTRNPGLGVVSKTG